MAEPKYKYSRELEEILGLTPTEEPSPKKPLTMSQELEEILAGVPKSTEPPFEKLPTPPQVKSYVPDIPMSKVQAQPKLPPGKEKRTTQPITTTGEPSVVGKLQSMMTMSDEDRRRAMQLLNKDQSFIDAMKLEFTNQQHLPPDKRSGVLGVAASIFPQLKGKSLEGTFKRDVVENTLPYVFRLLNVPSAYMAAGIETTAETVGLGTPPPDTEAKASNYPERLKKNLAKTIAKGEGLLDAGGKAGTIASKPVKALEKTTGLPIERVVTGIGTAGASEAIRAVQAGTKAVLPESLTKDKLPSPDFAQVGKALGLGADILTPSTIEVPFAVKNAFTAPSKVVTSTPDKALPKIPVIGETKTTELLNSLPEALRDPSRKGMELTQAMGRPTVLIGNPKLQVHFYGEDNLIPKHLGNVAVIQRNTGESAAEALTEVSPELTKRMGIDGYLVVNRLDTDLLTGRVSRPTSPIQGVFYKITPEGIQADSILTQSQRPLTKLSEATEDVAKPIRAQQTQIVRDALLGTESKISGPLRTVDRALMSSNPISINHPTFDGTYEQVSNIVEAERKYHELISNLLETNTRIYRESGEDLSKLSPDERKAFDLRRSITDGLSTLLGTKNPKIFEPDRIRDTQTILNVMDQLIRNLRAVSDSVPWDEPYKHFGFPTPELNRFGLPTEASRLALSEEAQRIADTLDIPRVQAENLINSLPGKSTQEHLEALNFVESVISKPSPSLTAKSSRLTEQASSLQEEAAKVLSSRTSKPITGDTLQALETHIREGENLLAQALQKAESDATLSRMSRKATLDDTRRAAQQEQGNARQLYQRYLDEQGITEDISSWRPERIVEDLYVRQAELSGEERAVWERASTDLQRAEDDMGAGRMKLTDYEALSDTIENMATAEAGPLRALQARLLEIKNIIEPAIRMEQDAITDTQKINQELESAREKILETFSEDITRTKKDRELLNSLKERNTKLQEEMRDVVQEQMDRVKQVEELDTLRKQVSSLGEQIKQAENLNSSRRTQAYRVADNYSRDVLSQRKLVERVDKLTPDVSGRGANLTDKISEVYRAHKRKQAISKSLVSTKESEATKRYDDSLKANEVLRSIFNEYEHRLNGISERFKYWARKSGPDGIEISKAFDEVLKDSPNPSTDYQHALATVFTDRLTLPGSRGVTPPANKANKQAIYNTLLEVFSDIEVPSGKWETIWTPILDSLGRVVDELGNINVISRDYIKYDGGRLVPSKSLVDLLTIKDEVIPDLYFELAVESAARFTQNKLASNGFELLSPESLRLLRVEAPKFTVDVRGRRVAVPQTTNTVTPTQLREVILNNLQVGGDGYAGFVQDIAKLQNRPFPEVFQEFLDNQVGFELLQRIRENTAVTSLAESVYDLVGTPLARDRLAHSFASNPQLASVVEHLPDHLKERGSKYLVDRLFNLVQSKDLAEVSLGLRLLRGISDITSRMTSTMKQATLGGLLVPNVAYHTVNTATAPLIIYQNLGLPMSSKSIANFPEAAGLISDIYSSKVPMPVRITDELTSDDVIKLFQENNLATSQVNFELSNNLKEDMAKYLGTTLSQRRLPISIDSGKLQFSMEGFKNYAGLQGSNIYSEFATAMDNTWKMSVLISSLRDGDTPAIAVKKAREALFDYPSLTDFEKGVFRNMLWYQSFWRHNIVSTLKNLTSVKGSTRIKNQLMLVKDRPEAEQEYSEAKPYLGPTVNSSEDRYGPGIPTAEAVNFLAKEVAGLAMLAGIGGANREGADIQANIITEKLGSNKWLDLVSKIVFDQDLGRRRPVGKKLPVEYEMLFKQLGILNTNKVDPGGIAAQAFGLTYDNDTQSYEMNDKPGRAYFTLFKDILATLVVGRNIDVAEKTIKPKHYADKDGIPLDTSASLIEQMFLRGSGIGTSYKKQTILDTINQRNKDLQGDLGQ